MENISLEEKDLKYIWHPCSQMKDYENLPPIIIDKGKGIYLYDIYGNEYIDIISSWWSNLLGHSNDKINNAIKNQLDKLEHVIFANFSHTPAIELSEKLVHISPKGLDKCNFSDNGSAAVESALKMAFQYQFQKGNTKKTKFMCLSGGYHGETIGALSVGALDLYAKIYEPILIHSIRIKAPDCYRCPFNKTRDTCSTECFMYAEYEFEKHGAETCALILEPLLQGSAGMRIYPKEYLQKLRKICDEYNVILIADEIATGFGRTGKMFAFDHAEVSPDMMCISKGLTGGYMPMSVTLTSDEIYYAFYDDYNKGKAFMHSHTYSGNPLGCSAANAVIDMLLNENIIENAQITAKYLTEKMNERFLNHKNIGEIRHIGLIHAMELVVDKKTKEPFDAEKRIGYEIYKKALKKGLILRPLGNVLYFNPALIITKEQLDTSIDIAYNAIVEVLGE